MVNSLSVCEAGESAQYSFRKGQVVAKAASNGEIMFKVCG
jgi:hypothetical protein